MTTEALSDSGNERIAMGANMSPFDAHKVNIEDLYEEATAWLSGEGVTSEAEERAVDQLLNLVREARKSADEARKAENEPFDTGKAAVQAKYNPILKRADLIAETCKNVLKPWRDKVAAEKAAKAEAARADAEKLAREAQEKIRASAGNIVERERAEDALSLAKEADKFAKHTAKAAASGTGLRRSYRADLADLNAAIKHYWPTHKADFEALVCELAARDVRTGQREIPGFNIVEERKAI